MPDESNDAALDEYFLLWVLMAQTKDAVQKAREKEFARWDISNDRRAVLHVIEIHGGRSTPVGIARELFRELHSVTEMLKRMEKDGLLVRSKGTGRSKVEVMMTEKGLDVLVRSRHNLADQRIFSVLNKGERERLTLYLWKLRSRVLQDLGIPEWQLDLQNPNGRSGDSGA